LAFELPEDQQRLLTQFLILLEANRKVESEDFITILAKLLKGHFVEKQTLQDI